MSDCLGITEDMLLWFFIVLSITWGSCIGSFLNACIHRIPREISLTNPKRSFCPQCDHVLPWYLNIPLISYLALRGKCKYCSKKIIARYFLVELLTAFLFLLAFLKLDMGYAASPLRLTPVEDIALIPVYWLVISGLILGTFVDFEHYILPDRVTIGGMVAGVAISIALPSLHGETSHLASLVKSMIGLTVGFGSLWLIGYFGKLAFKKDAMGFGDVKLMGAIGAFFGWQSILYVIMLSSFAGSIVGIVLVCAKKREMSGRIPFGPYLALSALLWMFWGQTWWAWYVGILTTQAL